MKPFRLIVHQKTFSDDDLVISQKDYPEANKNDIVEIYHPLSTLYNTKDDDENNCNKKIETVEEDFPRLLLQIKSFKDDLNSTRTISVEQSIAAAFGLKTYKDVIVKLVDPTSIALDSIEITFKEQYMGRSEMWRLKNCLVNTCVYMNKKLEFCGGAIRCQVYEMWVQGDRVACGMITEETNVVFRSSTAMVYIFLQMSSEMWDFDIYGDLYFEKAVNGFLSDLFLKWKKNCSNHEITIVLFSRTFYEANTLEEFPECMRECLQKDYKGRYYEDFYRVAIQNERFDDCNNILVQLRRIFQDYLKTVLTYHCKSNQIIPSACNSTAAQGNFLEVLNMSLNVFEKHYLDRSFDRTGQLSVVVTPGVGVFEVDRELTNITKQRIIDGGVGSDLVCVGEQPLHAVPLLKFHNKDSHLNRPDNYSMPHWINLSFYSTNKKIPYSNFVPRIKLPPQLTNANEKKRVIGDDRTPNLNLTTTLLSSTQNQNECIRNSFFDYDAYDAAVFQYPSVQYLQEVSSLHSRFPKSKKSSCSLLPLDSLEFNKNIHRKLSDPDLSQLHRSTNINRRSEPIAIPLTNSPQVLSPHIEEFSPPMRMVVGSEGSPTHESRALINPFDPSHVTIKLTSNRRRWTHIFPKGPTGILIQQHHYQAVPTQGSDNSFHNNNNNNNINVVIDQQNVNKLLVVTPALQEYCKKRPNYNNLGAESATSIKNSTKSLTLLWGATGEQEWTPALTTGVDWKSLIIPACLPITTDYFPDRRTLDTDYVVSLYSLVPDSVYADFAQQRGPYKKPFTTDEVFRELISQRLAQGFQLILMDHHNNKAMDSKIKSTTVNQSLLRSSASSSTTSGGGSKVIRKSPAENDETFYLSIGRLFHRIFLSGNIISVTRYNPRHPYPGFKYQYRYRFYAPYHDNYEESYATFTTEKLEHYNWNYLDHYVCTGGGTNDFELVDALKYWRFRIYLLPLNCVETKKIVDGAPRCDIYTLPTNIEHQQMIDGFLKFIETAVNKLKKSNNASKKTRMSLHIQNLPLLVQPRRNSMSNFCQNIGSSNSPFRERLGSNRLADKPRPRSGSKVLEKNRLSQDQSSIDLPETNAEDLSVGIVSLKTTSTNIEIIEAMKHQNYGLSFMNSQQNLPNYTFVTADAVNWVINHRDGVTTVENAVQIMQNLHKEKLIRHASGDLKKPFVYGFVLFYILPDKDDKDSFQLYGDLETFENDFIEVEIKSPLNWGMAIENEGNGGGPGGIQILGSNTSCESNEQQNFKIPHFLQDNINPNYSDIDSDSKLFKRMRLETDIMNKSGRNEWGHAKYQTIFRPDQAYELVVEWLTSSGSIVADLLFGWYRKAQSCNLQMIPIPHDPLALPYSKKSDPLRGPIFIPLDISCLESTNNNLFKDFNEDSWLERMFLFQEAIIQNFGFIKCLVDQSNNTNNNSNQTNLTSREHQYIHATGTIFILISMTVPKNQRSRTNSLKEKRHMHLSKKYSIHTEFAQSPHEAYITRHVSGKNKADYDNSKKMGFLWCWNHIVSKRWRTNQGVDSNFQVKCLKDFRAFCSNSENRLYNFWRDSLEAKENAFNNS